MVSHITHHHQKLVQSELIKLCFPIYISAIWSCSRYCLPWRIVTADSFPGSLTQMSTWLCFPLKAPREFLITRCTFERLDLLVWVPMPTLPEIWQISGLSAGVSQWLKCCQDPVVEAYLQKLGLHSEVSVSPVLSPVTYTVVTSASWFFVYSTDTVVITHDCCV